MSHFFHWLCRQRQEFQRKPKIHQRTRKCRKPNTEASDPIFSRGVRAVSALWRDGRFTVIPAVPGQESPGRRAPSPAPPALAGSPPWRGRSLSEHGGFSCPSSLCHLWRWRVSQALPHMPGPVAGWHKAGIVHARRPERRANCLSLLGATICWQPDLCHYITGDSPTCKRISRTCLSSLILEKQ